jgi:serine phosphatase RsbU (regulator of sigma subunit)
MLYRAANNEWSLIPEIGAEPTSGNLPLGLDEETRYHSFDFNLERGDLVVLYTDALSETADPSGVLLGEIGLLESVRALDMCDPSPAAIGKALLQKVAGYRQAASADDDATLLVLFHNGSGTRRLSLADKLDVYAKVFGLKAV